MDRTWIMPTFFDSFNTKTSNLDEEEDEEFGKRKRAKLSIEEEVPKNENSPICNLNKNSNFGTNNGAQKLWCDKYKPKKIDDLIVNRKKVQEVENWLKNVWKNNYGKTLLITGPPGCGKLSTLLAVCKSLEISVIEWTSPLGITKDSTQETKFSEFLLQASKYSSLILGETESRRIVLIKDIPSIFLENPDSFHEVIIKHTRPKGISPIVFVISCADLVRNLFPDDVKYQLNLANINFNPVTETAMLKGLEKVIRLQRNVDEGFRVPSKDDLVDVCRSCDGDLRSALLKLQFGIAGGGRGADIFKVPTLDANCRRTRVKKTTSKKFGVKQVVSEIDKDKKLDFFHLVGRVLYPKKVAPDTGKFTFVHSPGEIVDTFITEPNKLVNILHENYLERFSSMKEVCAAAESLEDADALLAPMAGRDALVEYALSVAVRGLMTANQHPTETKWRPLSKSRIYETECGKKQNVRNMRALLPDSLAADDVLLDVVPYLSRLNIVLPPEKQALMKTLITYKNN